MGNPAVRGVPGMAVRAGVLSLILLDAVLALRPLSLRLARLFAVT